MSVLDQLPTVSEKRMAVRVTPDARRQIAAGHPWIFNESITSISHRGVVGDLAVIFDNDRNFVAIGLWDPGSPIRIRVLHHGKPATIDADFWQQRLTAAIERRGSLGYETSDTNGYRILNGENDGFPGLVLDRYADTYVLKVYSPVWIPHLRTLTRVIDETLKPEALVLRLARTMADQRLHGLSEGMALIGEAPTAPVLFLENGLTFEADVVHGQKTGHFLDQRENRALVGSMSAGMRVLDVFSATGGFGVYAAAGGAIRVTSVDQSEPTLAVAERNFAHNASLPNVRHCEHDSMIGDAYEVMDRLIQRRKHYDIVVVDPPAFAQRKSNVDRALHAYGQLTQRAVQLVRTDGLLVQASCSSRVEADQFYATVRGSAQRAGYDLVEVRRTAHAIDHPVTFAQGGYLKALFARVIPLEY
ncbi:MAG TPA: class I SAM-dependent rRNA methyltransferase [Ilumatobacteraceae bacterium]|nr:class I SAM-dependent rRNA methyltransferase [Ilumatobacteraceae bacterium]